MLERPPKVVKNLRTAHRTATSEHRPMGHDIAEIFLAETAVPRGSERRRGIDRVIMLLEALLQHRTPVRPSDIARLINAPRSTTYEIVNSLLAAEMLETVGSEGHVYFGRAMHLFGWAYSHHNTHYRRIIETMETIGAETG